jgi:hypothetical protein
VQEDEVRQLVRDAIARYSAPADPGPALRMHTRLPASGNAHASHAIYVNLVNDTESCVIEPAVACSHCNYCKSHGF